MIHIDTKLDLCKALGSHDDLQCIMEGGGGLCARRGCLKVKFKLADGSSQQPTRNKEEEKRQVWLPWRHESKYLPDYNFSFSRVSSGFMQQQWPSGNYHFLICHRKRVIKSPNFAGSQFKTIFYA